MYLLHSGVVDSIMVPVEYLLLHMNIPLTLLHGTFCIFLSMFCLCCMRYMDSRTNMDSVTTAKNFHLTFAILSIRMTLALRPVPLFVFISFFLVLSMIFVCIVSVFGLGGLGGSLFPSLIPSRLRRGKCIIETVVVIYIHPCDLIKCGC